MPTLPTAVRRMLALGATAVLPTVLILTIAPSSQAATTALAPGCTWQAHALPVPDGWTQVIAMHGDGDATYVGYGTDTTGASRALRWSAGTVQAIGATDDTSAVGMDVNRSGVVAINGVDATGVRYPYLWQDGIVTRLASPPGSTASVSAINDAGVVVGSAPIDGGTHALAWTTSDPSTYTDLGTGGNVNAYPLGVSNAGLIVGRNASTGYGLYSYAITATTDPLSPMQVLPGLDPTYNSRATAAEGSFIVGIGRLPGSSNGATGGPVYFDTSTSTSPLALLGKGTPSAVNSSGLIAGAGPGPGFVAAVVWSTTERWEMPNPFGALASSSATDVMDNGTVLGYVKERAQVGLTRQPNPTTWTCE